MLMDLSDADQSDSGMESLTASKDDTPERRPEDISFITPVPVQVRLMKGTKLVLLVTIYKT